jgi:hypothetical protein
MFGIRQENGARPKHDQRRERPHRAAKSRPRSLRASGVTPASCRWKSQLAFWPRKSSVGRIVCGAAYSLSDKIACGKETSTWHS